MSDKTTWFDNHPIITIAAILLFLLILVEATMHGLYWLGLLPSNVVYMTQKEKADYRDNVNNIIYEDYIPRRANGYSTYTQRDIPAQYIKFDQNGMREDGYRSTDHNDAIIGVFGDSYTDALQVGQLDKCLGY